MEKEEHSVRVQIGSHKGPRHSYSTTDLAILPQLKGRSDQVKHGALSADVREVHFWPVRCKKYVRDFRENSFILSRE